MSDAMRGQLGTPTWRSAPEAAGLRSWQRRRRHSDK
jgi:hypothetical protein